ncbi:MAG: carbamoyltransferase, partial [Pyrinomonadaceae bacterium]
FPSPYDEAVILTSDGVGEWATTTWGVGEGNRIRLSKAISFPHSLGLLYSAFTYFTGFKVNSGEYKLMGLAPYGEPRYESLIRDHMIDIKDDGSFWLDQSYFNYCAGLTMTGAKFHSLFGQQPRRAEDAELTQFHMDVAASIQKVTGDVMMRIVRHVHAETGMENLCMAGGVALNCVANGIIAREGPFKNVWIQPAAGDAGGSLGGALFAWYQLMGNERGPASRDSQHGSYLGPRFSNEEIREVLDSDNAAYTSHAEDELCRRVAELLDSGKVVGLFQGRMEFGPRALGGRSILGDPRRPEMQAKMNLKIKFRESFRPFAPSVLAERAADYFDLDTESPYMLLVAPVQDGLRKQLAPAQQGLFGIDKLNLVRSDLPAVTHVDYSARVQTVDDARNGRYYRIIKAFEALTGCGVVINTSFNIRGEPIVCRPEEAYRTFMCTDMDALVIEDQLLLKEDQAAMPEAEEYKRKFKLD